MLQVLEKELAPTLICITFCISVGAFYGFAAFLMVCIILNTVLLVHSYESKNYVRIMGSRIGVMFFTVCIFLILLADDHVFEDTTLPQRIEKHMTDLARNRHGDSSLGRLYYNSTDGKYYQEKSGK